LKRIPTGTNAISVAVAFSLFHLISNPDKLQRLVQELREALPDHDGTGSISSEVLINLPYLSAVIEESMRLGAPLGTFARVAPEGGAVLAGQFVPGGTIVSVPAWAQNIDEKVGCETICDGDRLC
jgi:cytochrome P450